MVSLGMRPRRLRRRIPCSVGITWLVIPLVWRAQPVLRSITRLIGVWRRRSAITMTALHACVPCGGMVGRTSMPIVRMSIVMTTRLRLRIIVFGALASPNPLVIDYSRSAIVIDSDVDILLSVRHTLCKSMKLSQINQSSQETHPSLVCERSIGLLLVPWWVIGHP